MSPLFTLLFFLPIISVGTEFQQMEHPRLKLTWDFYKNGKPPGEYYSACTFANFLYKYQIKSYTNNEIKLKFVVNYKLDTAKSYFDEKLLLKDYNLLAHEQGHVDLGVIYARKLYNELSKSVYYRENYKKKIDYIFKKVLKDWNLENQRYDKETAHCQNVVSQNHWNLFFDAYYAK
jgi:hypothetical protein